MAKGQVMYSWLSSQLYRIAIDLGYPLNRTKKSSQRPLKKINANIKMDGGSDHAGLSYQ